ncbi:hypothetical protein AS032_31175 [Rhodococcus qingshengii]|nr:hypothetical protein AS032_31175 [Rhodococcus qingshengii]
MRQDTCMTNQSGDAPIQISGNPTDLIQLMEWFRHDNALRGRIQLQAPPAQDGQMGGLADVLLVAVGSGGIGTALVASLKAWFANRNSDVNLKVTLPTGAVISVEGKRVKQDEIFSNMQTMIDSLDTTA